MKYDLEESYIGTIDDVIPRLESPEQIRSLCVDGNATDDEGIACFTFAQRIKDKVRIEWIEGEDEDQKFTADLWPKNPSDDSDLDYWQWEGELHCSYIRYDAGWHADQTMRVSDSGTAAGWMFEEFGGCMFVGQLQWESGDTERVVIELIE